ncbi:MAG TPA: SGNH/GDSL hydrolase family protein [Phycisphaerae bacterium]|nr:SGNH/GDSL hydrolase family protein [Phycisphaerae bacterium]
MTGARSTRFRPAACAVAWLLLAACGAARAAEPPCALKGGETIVFFGDSITQGGAYVEYVDAFLATRMPGQEFHIVNSGISSETISGTSETDHHPRRPWAHERFDRDVAAHKPQILVACFGMNDGNYHPFERLRFEKYQAGVRLLMERCHKIECRLILLTPPPFDPYRRGAGDPNATEYGYKFAAVDYDTTLEAYSQWLLGLRREGYLVADVHTATNEHLRARRRTKVSFFLAGDAVHPNATGHWLMAQTLLEAIGVPAAAGEVEIDAAKAEARKGETADVEAKDGGVAFQWARPLPMPIDPQWDGESLALEKTTDRLGRYVMTVTGLPAGTYRLEADGAAVGEASAGDLAKGLDLNALAKFPTHARAREVLGLVQQRRRTIYKAWRQGVASGQDGAGVAATMTAERSTHEILEKVQDLCQPRPVRVRILPVR